MTGSSSYHSRLLAGTALLSLSLLGYQIAMIQLLSMVQWHHFANMVISIALLGFGAAGATLALINRWILRHSSILLPVLMLLSGLTMVTAVTISKLGWARFDSYLLFVDRMQWLALVINYLLFFFPFFFGALALGIIFVKYVREISRFYFSNLFGSAIGMVIAAALAWYFWPSTLPAVMAIMATTAGFIVLPAKTKWPVIVFASGTFLFVLFRIIYPVSLSLSEYKSLSRTLTLPSSRITIQKPGPHGFVQVVSAEALRYAPGLSLAFTGEVPVKNVVFNNGDWFGPVVSWNSRDSFHLLDFTTMAVPYAIEKRKSVLVLHAGTGINISHALRNKVPHIDAVESHRTVLKLLYHELAKETDSLFYHPAVKLHVTEPRSFLSTAQKKYDLIELPLLGAFGGGAGLSAMREEYTLTREAFLQMWDLLERDGVISVSSWMDYPFRNPLKIAATLGQTLKAAGISDPHLHLAAIRSWGTVTFLLKKSAFNSTDTSRIRKFCDSLFFDPLLLPGLRPGERSFYNVMSDTSFFSYTDELFSGKEETLFREYDFHLRPATDDKPYFSQFLRWKSLPHLAGIFGSQSVSFLELGWLVSAITFLQISLLAILLIILPLFKMGWRGRGRPWTLFYFSGLGIGYMFLEIVLIQKFILFFGNPVYTAAFVIGVMLFASGAGSYFSSRYVQLRATMQRILFLILLCLLVYIFLLPVMLQEISGFPPAARYFISSLLIAGPAFMMGMPFPMGLKALAQIEEKNLPWAWGINSCMSVISAALATLLAVEAGFSLVIILAAVAYGMSLFSVYFYRYS